MKYKGYNVLTLKTSNEEIHHIQLALGIDLGTCRFATIATTEGNIEIIGSEALNHYCMLIEAGESTEASMNMWLFKKVKAIVQDWYDRGVEVVYVGCCKGDYLTLCGGDEEHPFYKYGVFEKFVDYLEVLCRNAKIHIETTDFDESYTSRASSINGDYIPNRGDENIPLNIHKPCTLVFNNAEDTYYRSHNYNTVEEYEATVEEIRKYISVVAVDNEYRYMYLEKAE